MSSDLTVTRLGNMIGSRDAIDTKNFADAFAHHFLLTANYSACSTGRRRKNVRSVEYETIV